MGMQIGVATVENSMEFSQKIKNRTTLWPSNCTTSYLSKGYRSAVLKGYMHTHVYSSTIDNIQHMERTQMPIVWWVDKEDFISNEKSEILPFETRWMELEGIMLSKISQSEKTNIIWYHSYVEFKKHTDEQMNIGEGKEK